MACDIHWFVEKRVDGAWTCVWPECYADREEVREEQQVDFPGRWVSGNEHWRLIDEMLHSALRPNRNYSLFAILADVRNDSHLEPICAPRGFPPDASPFPQWESRRMGDDGHSHSYFALQELLDANWAQSTYVGDFTDVTLPALQELGPVENIRVVFFFDN